MEQKGSTTIGLVEQPKQASPELESPTAVGQTESKPAKRMSAFDRKVAQLAAQRDAAEKAYQAELAKANKKHAVGYIRVSTTAQGNDDKYGPEVQRDAIIQYADQNG